MTDDINEERDMREAELTTQQKAMALLALTGSTFNFAIMLRDNGSWYTSLQYVEMMTGDGMLVGVSRSGSTPDEAIENTWRVLTAPATRIAIRAYQNDRREVRWNGYMWKDVPR